jgi:hypothetical protein
MAGITARLSLPFPQLTDAADISQAVPPLTTLLDTIMLAYAKGLHSARPAASATQMGRIYYETDTGIAFFCDGSVWQRLDLDVINRIITLESKTVNAWKVSRVTPAAVFNGASSSVSWDTPGYALGDCAAIGTGPDFVIPTTGLYHFDMMIAVTAASSKTNLPGGFGIVKATTHMDDDNHAMNFTGGGLDTYQVHSEFQCTTGDHVRVQGYCTGASDVTWAGSFSSRRIQQ